MERVWYSLYDRMLSVDGLREAFDHVKSSGGGPGVDGQTIEDFEADLEANLLQLVEELREKTYQPQPVRRVAIPKPSGGTRLLGIPTVRDRVVQQRLRAILEPLFEPHFHPSSYAYRPNRSCHDAIQKAELFLREHQRQWVVEMDLSKCFDTLDHELILALFRRRVADGSLLGLLRQFLESGVLAGGRWEPSGKGSPQGGVISPLIANVYLDAFDQEMARRGHRIVRYADDILILSPSRSSAERACRVATEYLEGALRLRVNREKTRVTHASDGVAFLGMVLKTVRTVIAPKNVRRFRMRVKALTSRNRRGNLRRVIRELNHLLRGFSEYFRIAACRSLLRALMGWVQRRLRMLQLVWWKHPRKLFRRLRQVGWRGWLPRWVDMRSWRLSRSQLATMALPNAYFADRGLYDMTQVFSKHPVSPRRKQR